MQPPKLALACLESRTRDGSHGTIDKKPDQSNRGIARGGIVCGYGYGYGRGNFR
jgi:hypothetical protein